MGSYVYANSMDIASNDGNSGLGNQASNPFNIKKDYGRSDFDVRHRFTTSFVYQIPSLVKSNSFAKALIGGWQVNGILTLQTGLPFTVLAGVRPQSCRRQPRPCRCKRPCCCLQRQVACRKDSKILQYQRLFASGTGYVRHLRPKFPSRSGIRQLRCRIVQEHYTSRRQTAGTTLGSFQHAQSS